MPDNHPEHIEVQDFTNEPIPPLADVREIPYDPRPQEDTARRWIAYILLGILAFAFIAPVVTVIHCPDRLDGLLKLYQLIFTPLIALVSASTGFYYGTKSRLRKK